MSNAPDERPQRDPTASTRPLGAPRSAESTHAPAPNDAAGILGQPRSERFSRQHLLGAGGMGEVHAYRDEWIGRDVAVKTLKDTRSIEPEYRERFLREVRVQGQLEHPSVIPVYDVDLDAAGDPMLTMRKVKGLTLADVLDALAAHDRGMRERYSQRRLLTAFTTICQAVHYAHTRGVIHRDLKPSNIMLGDFGEVYILDWGVARTVRGEAAKAEAETTEPRQSILPVAKDTPADLDATNLGNAMGTIGYIPREVLEGKSNGSVASDVFALGVILFEMLTLESMFRGTDRDARIAETMRAAVHRPSDSAPDENIAPELDEIVVRATAPEPADRFESARALAESVEKFLDGDRDLALRRDLARDHLARVERLLGRVDVPASPRGLDADARSEALREVLRAMALDPSNAEAQRWLGRLVMEVPETLPPDAQRMHDEAVQRARMELLRMGARALFAWALAFPWMLWIGVRQWALVAGGAAITVGGALWARAIHAKGTFRPWMYYALLGIAAVAIAMQSAWLGPAVVMPTSIAFGTAVFVMYGDRRERSVAYAVGLLLALAPFAAEWLGLVSPSMRFEDGTVVLLPRALDLPRHGTIAAMLYVSIVSAVVPATFFRSMRETLDRAQRGVHFRAWQMEHLFTKGESPPA